MTPSLESNKLINISGGKHHKGKDFKQTLNSNPTLNFDPEMRKQR